MLKNNVIYMKRFILSLFFCFASVVFVSAQEHDSWVGEWTSEAYSDIDWEASRATEEVVKAYYRIIIRITKNGDQYSVRGKTIKLSDPNYTNYHTRYTITKIDNNTMWLQQYLSKQPFYVNGEIDEYSDITKYSKLTIENGGLHYVFYSIHSVNYDRNMRYRSTDDFDYSNEDHMLYNDNW
jgi:hypothetical protein